MPTIRVTEPVHEKCKLTIDSEIHIEYFTVLTLRQEPQVYMPLALIVIVTHC